ncbi:Yip1-domain-containing protein [Hanseniaspora valbyensis NRRL Y-1626]|uniref:Yip1-domain-containing protein n=1 Tax=Hanseniaspora valbyensis NRRL Y-1626 TaxID=766949 RepID=A0A1B7TJ43_9ASCO|nr:Yip1-domain-containing protein [Hanseniaspora valbyensis NRRL Y-1626]
MSFYNNYPSNGGYMGGSTNNNQFYGQNSQNQYPQQSSFINQQTPFQNNGYPQQPLNNNLNGNSFMSGSGYPSATHIPSMNTRNPDEILPSGLLNALSTAGYSDELPLMEELGINFSNIWQNTKKSILFKNKHHGDVSSDEIDLAGPLFFVILYGALLYVYSGKLHFGYIYGVGLFGSISIHFLLKLMNNDIENKAHNNANPSSTKDNNTVNGLHFLQTCSILGYSFLPLCILSGIGIFTHLNSNIGLILSFVIVSWCSASSSGEFVKMLSLNNVRLLVAYPLFIFYSVFASMIVFG